MFTGIVRELGRVDDVERNEAGARLRISGAVASKLATGDSVSVEGACLTVAGLDGGAFEADVMNQTLSLTTLGELTAGDPVNLERALRAGEPLGGHIVQGHVDGVAEVVSAADDGIARRLGVRVPDGLERYAVEHGSVTLAGVSLTVAAVDGDRLEVSLIPETLERTTLRAATEGKKLNLELDVLARYVERLLGFKETR
ncbi:MAG TPA: riboflavin synthase [Solirubrobacterales bacterium]|nr:riboflavin synthase [Solirubrobacterales bacterium]